MLQNCTWHYSQQPGRSTTASQHASAFSPPLLTCCDHQQGTRPQALTGIPWRPQPSSPTRRLTEQPHSNACCCHELDCCQAMRRRSWRLHRNDHGFTSVPAGRAITYPNPTRAQQLGGPADSHRQGPLHGWPSNSTSGPDQNFYTAGPTWNSWGLPGRASTGMRRHLGASTLSRVGTPSTMPWCLRRLRRTVRANGSVPASLRSPRRRRVGSALAPALALHCEDWYQLDRYWCLLLCGLQDCSLKSLLQVLLDQAARPVLGQHGMQAVLLTIERPQSACAVHAA